MFESQKNIQTTILLSEEEPVLFLNLIPKYRWGGDSSKFHSTRSDILITSEDTYTHKKARLLENLGNFVSAKGFYQQNGKIH